MFSSIWPEIKLHFRSGNTLTRIIWINIGVFVFVNILRFILFPIEGSTPPPTYQKLIEFFAISSDPWHNLTHPWVFFTHMFLHEGLGHIFWNMVLLYLFGRIVGDLLGDRRVLPVYLMGGLTGGIVYFLLANLATLWEFGLYALGASAAMTAMLLAAGKTAPDYSISLAIIGVVKLKFLVAASLFIDIIALSWNNNSGGAFAHLGGAAMGYLIAVQLQKGNDWTQPIQSLIERITGFFQNLSGSKYPKPKTIYKRTSTKRQTTPSAGKSTRPLQFEDEQSYQHRLDAILDKIKLSGYDSLSAEEKEFLFNASKR